MIINIIIFLFGVLIGIILISIIIGAGKINKESEYYSEGFVDGYNKAKQELLQK